MKNNPYVGPRPFERQDRPYFYGRNREARDLLSLILAERVVLFYAPSGAGKSSLLNTQIIPDLEEEEGFRVLPVTRVGSDLPPGLDPQAVENIFLFSALMGLAGDDFAPQELIDHDLPSFLQRYRAQDADVFEYRPPILIIDQFEEILTKHRDRISDVPGFFRQVAEALDDIPSLGIVLTMSDEYVAGLDPYAPLLPKRLRGRYRMERLDQQAALEAVKKPALAAGCTFDPGVAERLVDDLRRIKSHLPGGEGADDVGTLGPYVEPVQLQVVCSQLWENLPDQEDQAIQWEEVEKFGDIDQALTDFYESGLARCVRESKVSERDLRRWFGEQLITPMQTRGLVLQGERDTGGLPNEAVDILDAQHLIRADARAGARWYELAHDRLVDPILESNQAWELACQTPLRLAARRWKESGDAGILYRGRTLEEALVWADGHPDEIESYEIEFLEASQQAERDRIRKRNLQILGAATAAVVILVVSTLAMLAYRASPIARSREWASNSMRYRLVDQEQSIIMAQIAVAESETTEAQIALRQAIIDYFPGTSLPVPDTDYAVSVAYSPDGEYVAASGANGRVNIWNAQTHAHVQTMDLESGPVNWIWGLAYSPDGHSLAIGGNPPIRVWDVAGEAGVTTLEGHTGLVYSLAYSPDGRYLASGSHDKTARIWDLTTGTAVVTLTAHTGAVRSLAYSPDGRYLVTGSWDGNVRLWAISTTPTGALIVVPKLTLVGHSAAVNSVAFSPDGTLVASGSEDKTIRLWDVNTGRALLALVGHTDLIMSLSFSPDGRLLASTSRDATVRLWNVGLRQGEAIAMLTGHTSVVNGVAFSPAGRFLASSSADGTLRIWDSEPPQGALVSTLTGHSRTVVCLDYSPDGRYLASGSSDGTARLWAMSTGEEMAVFPVGSVIWGLTYSPDGNYLVTCSSDNLVRVWDVAQPSDTPWMTLVGHTNEAEAAAFSPDGRYLVTVSDDKTARLWDLSTGTTVFTMTGHGGALYAVAFSPDGELIATGSVDDDVRVWEAETGDLLAVLHGHTHDIFSLAFSPDSEYLASGSWDQTARLWSMETFTEEAVLEGHSGYVYSVAFSPEGDRLATGSWDRTTRIWDLTRSPPKTIAILIGHTDLVRSVAYSPGGRYVATGSRDATIRRYPARFEDVEDLSWEYVHRETTEREEELIDQLEINPFGD